MVKKESYNTIMISIAMAAYNGEKYIQEQLESYSKQTVLPDELVVVDDCSTDSTPEILKSFKEKAPFKVVIITNEKNIGSTKSFEKAIKATSGNWICLSDQDDVWTDNKIEEYVKAINESDDKIGLIYSDFEIVDEKLIKLQNVEYTAHKNSKYCSNDASIFLLTNPLPGAAMILRREAVFQTFPFSTKYHDNWLAWAISVNYRIKYLDKKLYLYRQHNNQQVGLGIYKKDKQQKNFFQKYIYDYEKFKRRREARIKSLNENMIFYKAANDFLNRFHIKNELFKIVSNGLEFYGSRLEATERNRLKRLMMLLPLLIKGYYKYFESKRAFSEFRRDIEFPMIDKQSILQEN